jgi:hypothetical protein
MMMLREIAILLYAAVLFCIGIGTAGLAAHLGGALIAGAFAINELIPAAIFFAVSALLGWIGNGSGGNLDVLSLAIGGQALTRPARSIAEWFPRDRSCPVGPVRY